jgi:hypothetical protein
MWRAKFPQEKLMTIRPKLIPELFAVFVSVASCTSFAQIQASSATLVAPLAASAPTVVPALVPYSGVAVDRDGHALSGETGITFLIYKDQNGGEPLFTETQSVVPDSTGHYAVHLGASMSSGIPLDLFSSGEARWLEVQIAGQPSQPRILLASVPYALKAGDATTLGGLPASAFALAASKTPAYAAGVIPAAIIPNAGATVTTTGGTGNNLAKFSGASTIVNSILFDNGTEVGIGTTSPSATLTVNGTVVVDGSSSYNGYLQLSPTGTANSSKANNSQLFKMFASVFNSSSKTAITPHFEWQVEPTGNNTSTTGATLNFLASPSSATAAETGLFINTNGTIHFAPGQTFPGGTGGGGAPMCIAVGGGFGGGGTTFVAPGFTVPAENNCTPWSGFTKTAASVILTTNGAACLSGTGKTLTVSVSSADPSFFPAGSQVSDYIQLTRTSSTGSFTGGTDQGQFGGGADQVTCTSSLLSLPDIHD